MSALQPHQQRVVDEKRDLDEKIEKLNAFFRTSTFHGLDGAEQGRLSRQAGIMMQYSSMLAERIAAFQ